MSDVSERVKRILVDHLGVTDEKVIPEALLVDDLGCDSLDTVELAMGLEEEFGIEIRDEWMQENLGTFTVSDLVAITHSAIDNNTNTPTARPKSRWNPWA